MFSEKEETFCRHYQTKPRILRKRILCPWLVDWCFAREDGSKWRGLSWTHEGKKGALSYRLLEDCPGPFSNEANDVKSPSLILCIHTAWFPYKLTSYSAIADFVASYLLLLILSLYSSPFFLLYSPVHSTWVVNTQKCITILGVNISFIVQYKNTWQPFQTE